MLKRRINNIKHWLLIALMGVLGFSACSKEGEEEQIHPMYGVVETTFNPSK